jgi:hypothetical protein
MAVLLLNASMQPLNVISHRRLVVLLTKERVAFVDSAAERVAAEALAGRRLPEGVVIVRLLRTIHRRNLLLRDDHTCQYCGRLGTAADLTVDHVIPVSRGGAPDRWENVVIACRKCNWRKANHRPEEVGLILRRKPVPLTQEYAHIIFLRYPELKEAYDRLLAAA